MRRILFALMLVGVAAPVHAATPAQARNFTYRFLHDYVQLQPTLYDLPKLSPYLSDTLQGAIAHAVGAEAQSLAITPKGDKPCLWEGDVFFGLYEGVTEYRVGRAYRRNGTYAVEATLTYHETGTEDFQWPVTLLLQDEPLRVTDVIQRDTHLVHELDHHCEE